MAESVRLQFDRGYLAFANLRGALLRIHWTWPIGMLIFTGGFYPIAWAVFGALVFAHECGHAVLAWRFRLFVRSIDIHGFGGLCHYRGDPSEFEACAIAWGGVLMQALILVVALIVFEFVPVDSRALHQVQRALVSSNVWLIAFNLLPIPPLDGSKAWRLPAIWWAMRRDLREYIHERNEQRAEEIDLRKRAAERKLRNAVREAEEADPNAELPPEVARQIDAAFKKPKA